MNSAPATVAIPGYMVGTWKADPVHSEIAFSVPHLMVSKVRGRFTSYDVTIVTSEDPRGSSVAATIDLASIDTGNEPRNNHLHSADYFEVEKYPTMSCPHRRRRRRRRAVAREPGANRDDDRLTLPSLCHDTEVRGQVRCRPGPHTADHVHAAAVPRAGLTAWQALFDHGKLAKGQTVVIHGAGGAVGSTAVQLARLAGAQVIGTGRSRARPLATEHDRDAAGDRDQTAWSDPAAGRLRGSHDAHGLLPHVA